MSVARNDRGGRSPIAEGAQPVLPGPDPSRSLYLWVGLDGALFVARGWDGETAWVGSAELAHDLDRCREMGPAASVVYSRERPELDPPAPQLVRGVIHLITERHLPMQIRPDLVRPEVEAYLDREDRFIHWAARNGRVDVLADLVARGAPLHLRDGEGRTALVLAVAGGHADAVGLLLESGANVRMLPDDGLSGIMLAADRGDADIVRLLVDHGARPLAKGRDGRSAADHARQSGHADLGAWLEEAAGPA